MSTRATVINFVRGMNNVAQPHFLEEGYSEEIVNLYLDDDGLWKDINNPEIVIDLSPTVMAGAIAVFKWSPSRLPEDCIDSFILIVIYSSGDVAAIYRTDDDWGIKTVKINAKLAYSDEYIEVLISKITRDLEGSAPTQKTTGSADNPIERRYLEGSVVSMTAPALDDDGNPFFEWINSSGESLSLDRTLTVEIENTTYIATYSWTPFMNDFAMLKNSVMPLLSNNKVKGLDIYIQPTEPSVPDCVWIDTRGIDLILE